VRELNQHLVPAGRQTKGNQPPIVLILKLNLGLLAIDINSPTGEKLRVAKNINLCLGCNRERLLIKAFLKSSDLALSRNNRHFLLRILTWLVRQPNRVSFTVVSTGKWVIPKTCLVNSIKTGRPPISHGSQNDQNNNQPAATRINYRPCQGAGQNYQGK